MAAEETTSSLTTRNSSSIGVRYARAMYKSALRAHQWATTGYVCRQCRYKLASREPDSTTQLRHASTSTTTPAGDAGADDWFANFNSLGEDTPAPSKSESKPAPRQDAKATDRKELRRKGKSRMQVQESTEDRDRLGLSKRLLGRPGGKPDGDFDKLKKDLEQSMGPQSDGKQAKRQDAAPTVQHDEQKTSPQIGTALKKRRRENPSSLRRKAQRALRLEAQAEAARGGPPADEVQSTNSSPIHTNGKVDAGDEEPRLAGVMPMLINKLEAESALRRTPKPLRFGESLDKAVASATHAADYVNVPSGIVSEQTAISHELMSTPSPIGKPKVTLPPTTTPRIRGLVHSATSNTFTAKLKEKNEGPAWGSSFSPARRVSLPAVSYDTLREADKVSPKPIVRTAGETMAYGVEPATSPSPVDSPTKSDLAEPPADLAESTQSDLSAAASAMTGPQPKQPKSSILSSFFDFGALKRTLAGRVGLSSGEVEKDSKPSESTATETSAAQVAASMSTDRPSGPKRGQQASKKLDPNIRKSTSHHDSEGSRTTKVFRFDPKLEEESPKSSSSVKLKRSEESKESKPEAPEVDTSTQDDASERLATLYKGRSPGEKEPEVLPGKKMRSQDEPSAVKVRKTRRRGPNSSLKVRKHLSKSVKDDADALEKSSEIGAGLSSSPERPKSLSEVMSSSTTSSRSGHDNDTASSDETVASPSPAETTVDNIQSVNTGSLRVSTMDIKQPPVPGLQYDLDRVLFNPGVYQLQDPHSRVFNFDPYLQKIMPVAEFDFNALKEYKTSSQDSTLSALARENGKKYVGSTSSMTGTLAHFHYLLSNFRPINLNMMSSSFPESLTSFTRINRAPNAIFLRWKNGTYAIDADKEFDGASVLMMLGKSMEKLLTLPKSAFERYRKSDPRQVTEAERLDPEAYEYTTMGDFLMRSQLDAYDPRLPGTGMFDLKTRAVVSVRMNTSNHEPMTGYQIHTLQGRWESYEREYYDMMRSTMLKYSLQARMGRMDGIFVAYHNVERIFGFQYLPIAELDRGLHGQIDPCLGDQEYKTSVRLLNEVLEMATKKFPEQSLRLHFEAIQSDPAAHMLIFAEPMGEEEIDTIQNTSKDKVADFERRMMGVEKDVDMTVTEELALKPNAKTSAATGEYSSSDTKADPKFVKSIDSDPAANMKPLFAATVILHNLVKGKTQDDDEYKQCKENRPQNLQRHEDWKVTYLLKEAPMTLEQAWARYEDMKFSRKQAFAENTEEDEEGEGAGASRQPNYFMQWLQKLSAKGREFRGKLDQMEAGRVPVVVGRPVSSSQDDEAESVSSEEGVKDVDEYMQWLYKHQRQ